jgi:hypothetical protein
MINFLETFQVSTSGVIDKESVQRTDLNNFLVGIVGDSAYDSSDLCKVRNFDDPWKIRILGILQAVY